MEEDKDNKEKKKESKKDLDSIRIKKLRSKFKKKMSTYITKVKKDLKVIV